MKKKLFLTVILFFTVTNAQFIEQAEAKKSDALHQPTREVLSTEDIRRGRKKSPIKKLLLPGENKNKVLIHGGFHKDLYGYFDERYVGSDQDDYIDKMAYYFSAEFVKSNLSTINSKLKNARIGGNVASYGRGAYAHKNLYAVSGLGIPAEQIPATERDRTKRIWVNIGFFAGLDYKWFGIDLGLTLKTETYYESYREKYTSSATPDNNATQKVDGRGWVWDNDSSVVPNLYIRLFPENTFHYTIEILRGAYDPQYGMIVSTLHLPASKYFTMKVGGYHYKSNAVFIEPTFKFKGFDLSVRTGAIISYDSDYLSRVGIEDSLFGAATLSYRW